MRKKLLMKIISILCAASAIATTPGLVNANPKNLQESKKNSNPTPNNPNNPNNLNNLNINIHLNQTQNNGNDSNQVELQNANSLIENGSLQKNQVLPLMEKLQNISKIEKYKKDVALIIQKMSSKNLLPDSIDQLKKAIDILKNCAQDSSSDKKEVTVAIKQMVDSQKILSKFSTYDQIQPLIETLKLCSTTDENKKEISYIINEIVSAGLCNNCKYDQLSPLIETFKLCLNFQNKDKNYVTYLNLIANSIKNLVKNNAFIYAPKPPMSTKYDRVLELISMLIQHSDKVDSFDITKYIAPMFATNIFDGCPIKKLKPVIEILKRNKDSAKGPQILHKIVDQSALDENDQSLSDTLLDILKKCQTKDETYIYKAIKSMARRGLIKQCGCNSCQKKIWDAITLLKKYTDVEKELLSINPYRSMKFIHVAAAFAKAGLLNDSKPNSLLDLTNILISAYRNCRNITKQLKKVARRKTDFWETIKHITSICDAQSSGMPKISDLLHYLENDLINNNHATDFADIIKNMAKNKWLDSLKPDQCLRIINDLNECSKFEKAKDASFQALMAMAQVENAQAIVAKSIEKMTLDNRLNQCCKEQLKEVIDALEKCSHNDSTKEQVALDMRLLAVRHMFDQFKGTGDKEINENGKQLRNIIYVLEACSNNSSAKEHIATTIDVIVKYDLLEALSKYDHKMLEETVEKLLIPCSESDDDLTKIATAHAIKSIVSSQECITSLASQILKALNNCKETKYDKKSEYEYKNNDIKRFNLFAGIFDSLKKMIDKGLIPGCLDNTNLRLADNLFTKSAKELQDMLALEYHGECKENLDEDKQLKSEQTFPSTIYEYHKQQLKKNNQNQ